MINNIAVGNDYLSHVVVNDDDWKLLMQQHNMPEKAQM
jgi:hypothetical protein